MKIKLIQKKYDDQRLWEEMREREKTRPSAEPLQVKSPPAFITDYTSFERMEEILGDLESRHPDIAQRYSIGLSEEGRQLWCLRITRDIKSPRRSLKPMVKFVANIHGDETVGRELLIGNHSLNIMIGFLNFSR